MTKGEMFSRVAEFVGRDAASDLLSATHSCGHTGQRNFKISPLQHCGVCFGCLLRRASFLASGLTDQTSYLSARTTDRPDDYLRSKSMVPSLRAFLARGLRPADLASLTLPSGYEHCSSARYLRTCHKGTGAALFMRSALPPLDLHAHIDVAVPATQLHGLRAVVFAATRSLGESHTALQRQDDLIVWGVGSHPGLASSHRSFDAHTFRSLIAKDPLCKRIWS